MQLRHIQYAGRTDQLEDAGDSDDSVDLDEVIARNKSKVEEQIKENMAK
jgi:hypothetical protein